MPESLEAFLAGEHAAERDELARTWAALDNVEPVVKVDDDRKAEIRARVLAAAERAPDRRAVEPLRLVRVKAFSMAAVIAVLLGVSFLLTPRVHTLRAPVGTNAARLIELSDGTSVALAPGSRISYTDDFGKQVRRVSLKGQAFFDVRKDGTPFTIDTHNARTRVVGTRFSIRAWPNDIDARTLVSVEEGVVSVQSRAERSMSVELRAGEATGVLDPNTTPAPPSSIDVSRAFVWLRGGFQYDNEPVGNVLRDLGRRFDLRFEAPATLQLRPISIFNQSDGTVEEVLGDICATIGVQYRRIAGGYELYAD